MNTVLKIGAVYTEEFVSGTQPTEECTCHVMAEVCEETNLLAVKDACDKVEKIFITRENSDVNTGWQSARDAKYMLPDEYCDVHKVGSKPTPSVTPTLSPTAKPKESSSPKPTTTPSTVPTHKPEETPDEIEPEETPEASKKPTQKPPKDTDDDTTGTED